MVELMAMAMSLLDVLRSIASRIGLVLGTVFQILVQPTS